MVVVVLRLCRVFVACVVGRCVGVWCNAYGVRVRPHVRACVCEGFASVPRLSRRAVVVRAVHTNTTPHPPTRGALSEWPTVDVQLVAESSQLSYCF